jgi:hypothetical protein
VIGEPLPAQLADDRARSTACRTGKARFAPAKALAELDLTAAPVSEAPSRVHRRARLCGRIPRLAGGGWSTSSRPRRERAGRVASPPSSSAPIS